MIRHNRSVRDAAGLDYELGAPHNAQCLTCHRSVSAADRRVGGPGSSVLSEDDFCRLCSRPVSDEGRRIEAIANARLRHVLIEEGGAVMRDSSETA